MKRSLGTQTMEAFEAMNLALRTTAEARTWSEA